MHPGGGRPHSLGTESFTGNKSVSFPHARHKVDSFGSLATTFREREREGEGEGEIRKRLEGEFGWPNGKRQTKERSKHSRLDLCTTKSIGIFARWLAVFVRLDCLVMHKRGKGLPGLDSYARLLLPFWRVNFLIIQ